MSDTRGHDPMTCTLGGCFSCNPDVIDPRVRRPGHEPTYRTDYTAPGVEPYWDREAGSASALLLLAGLIPLAFVVWFLANLAGAVSTVGGVQ